MNSAKEIATTPAFESALAKRGLLPPVTSNVMASSSCHGTSGDTIVLERIEPIVVARRSFASPSPVGEVSRLNQIALSLVGTTSTEKPTKKTLGSLEQAIRYLYKALSKIEGVYSPSRSSSSTIACYAHQPETLWVTRLSKKLPSDDLLDKSRQTLQQPEYDEGMRCFRSLLPISTKGLMAPSNHQLVCLLAYNIGQIRLLQERYDEARACFAEAYFLAAPDDSVFVPILHNIGYIQYRNGDIEKSLVTFTEALDYKHDKAQLAATLNCLGVLHFHMPKTDTKRSLEFLFEALSLNRMLYGSQHHSVATSLNNIGRVKYIEGDFEGALEVYNEALQLRRMLLGKDHLDVAATVFNAGQTLHHRGDLDDALIQYKEFMRITVPLLGYKHRDVAFMLKCIGQIHHQRGETELALTVYKQALVACKAALGIHAEVASVLNKLGNLYYDKGDFDSSLDMYRQGLEVERAVFDPYHPNITVTLSNIAQVSWQKYLHTFANICILLPIRLFIASLTRSLLLPFILSLHRLCLDPQATWRLCICLLLV